MGGKSAPAPDYTAAANSQASASKDITNTQNFANRPTINTPWGSQTWQTSAGIDPATGQRVTQWTQNNTLTPAEQKALESQQAIQQNQSDAAKGLTNQIDQNVSTPINWDGFNKLSTGPQGGGAATSINTNGVPGMGNVGQMNQQGIDAAYKQFSSLNDPLFQQQNDHLQASLVAQGLKPGDAAYDQAMNNQQNQQQVQRQQAQNQAVLTGNQIGNTNFGEQQAANNQGFGQAEAQFNAQNAGEGQNFNQQSAAASFGNQVTQQQIAQALQRQSAPINLSNALLTGQQVSQPNMPNFVSSQASQTPQLLQAAQSQYSAAQDGANAQNALTGSLIGAGAKIGSAMY